MYQRQCKVVVRINKDTYINAANHLVKKHCSRKHHNKK